MKRKYIITAILGLAVVAVVSGATAMDWEGGCIAATSIPIMIALAPLGFAGGFKRAARYAAYAFSTTILAILAFFYIGWIVDLGGMATGSSTSALMFVFVPLYALGAGCVVALIAVAAGTIHEFIIQRRPNHGVQRDAGSAGAPDA